MNISEKKFSIGLNRQQCIGPCYPAGSKILHPITLEIKYVKDRPFCPTMEWFNPVDNEEKWTDICLMTDKPEMLDYGKANLNYVLPTLGINCEIFLKSYYGIYSFEGTIDAITNNKMPFHTQLRLLNCAWKTFGSNIDIINDQLIELYTNFIKKEWIKEIYPYVAKYIYTDGKNIYLKENYISDESENNNTKNQNEKMNYFNKKFNNQQIIYKVISLYIKENKSNWDDIIDHNQNIKNYYIEYVVGKIIATINETL